MFHSTVVFVIVRVTCVFQIARKYDLLILEDDPYYFLQYGNVRTTWNKHKFK